MIKVKNLKKIKVALMQGRLSPQVGSKFQYFPITNWSNELKQARKLNFNFIEWIISDFSNPVFNNYFKKTIKKKLGISKMKISSISLDLLMSYPIKNINFRDADWLSSELVKVVKFFKIKRVSLPIEENARFNNYNEKKYTTKIIEVFYKKLSKCCKLCLETDIAPHALKDLLNNKKMKNLGLLLDLGNTKAHGFNIEEYFDLYSNKIFSVHVKYRDDNFGQTKYIKKNNFYELKYFLQNIQNLKNLGDITFQTFKTDKNFTKDLKTNIKNFNEYIK